MRYIVMMVAAGFMAGAVLSSLSGCAGTDLDICKGSGLCADEAVKVEPAKAEAPAVKPDEAAAIEAKAKAEQAKRKTKKKTEPPKQPLPNPVEDKPPVALTK